MKLLKLCIFMFTVATTVSAFAQVPYNHCVEANVTCKCMDGNFGPIYSGHGCATTLEMYHGDVAIDRAADACRLASGCSHVQLLSGMNFSSVEHVECGTPPQCPN